MLSKRVRSFTLIEILVVIAIIGILAALMIANMSTARMKGRDARRKADLKAIQTALESYADDNGSYPLSGGERLTSSSPTGIVLLGKYISTIPVDPLTGSGYPYWSPFSPPPPTGPYAFGLLACMERETTDGPKHGNIGWCPTITDPNHYFLIEGGKIE